jgi:protein translocase SecG subunit
MMIFTWMLTFLLVFDCLILTLLILIQLPKKEAGMGQAFGGSTTDALFGAGSGTALTKMTKYTAGIFFALTLLLSVLHGRAARSHSGDLRNKLTQDEKLSLIAPTKAPTNAAAAAAAVPPTNLTSIQLSVGQSNQTAITNAPIEKK